MKLRDAKLRSSCPEVFYKKDVLRNFAKFTGKHLCQRLFLNKVAGLASGVFMRILRNFSENLFYRTAPVAASANCNLTKTILSHIPRHVFCLPFLKIHHFLRIHHDYFFQRGFESVRAQFLSGNINEN